MAPQQFKSRIHFLTAKQAPVVVVLQRKRAKLFHVLTVHTRTFKVEEGSWFRGVLYPLRCDVSFDGKFMVYLAMGSNGKTWNGLCRVPWLTTLVDAENMGTWFGGGFFAGRKLLSTNGWGVGKLTRTDIPFALVPYPSRHGGEDLGVIYERLERDGFKRLGDNWGKRKRLTTRKYQIANLGDDGWGYKFSHRHPTLKVRYVGYLMHGYTFEFWFDEHAGLLEGARWANWDVDGNLWVAKPGSIERFTLKDLPSGAPSYCLDLDRFEPPERNVRGSAAEASQASPRWLRSRL